MFFYKTEKTNPFSLFRFIIIIIILTFLSFITIDNWLINNQSINDNWWLLPLIRKWYQDKPLYFVVYMYILHIEIIYIFLLTRLGKRGNNSLKADQDVKAVHWPQWSGSWWHLGGFNLTFHRCLWESLNEFFKQCYYQRNLYIYIDVNQHYDVNVLICVDIWGWEWGFGKWLYILQMPSIWSGITIWVA